MVRARRCPQRHTATPSGRLQHAASERGLRLDTARRVAGRGWRQSRGQREPFTECERPECEWPEREWPLPGLVWRVTARGLTVRSVTVHGRWRSRRLSGRPDGAAVRPLGISGGYAVERVPIRRSAARCRWHHRGRLEQFVAQVSLPSEPFDDYGRRPAPVRRVKARSRPCFRAEFADGSRPTGEFGFRGRAPRLALLCRPLAAHEEPAFSRTGAGSLLRVNLSRSRALFRSRAPPPPRSRR
jgi:hypothetical protein